MAMAIAIGLFQRFNDDRAEVAAAIDYNIDVMLSFEWQVDGEVYVNVDEYQSRQLGKQR